MNPAVDPWVITPRERTKYVEQFRALKPGAGDIVTGAQVREFFLQSQLPPLVLGEIWSLSDTDSDGRMDINEFSIACKLINLKLRSFDIPKVLPPALLFSLKQHQQNAAAHATPPTAMSPMAAPLVNNYAPPVAVVPKANTPPKVPPMMPPPMTQPPPPQQPSLIGGMPPVLMQQQQYQQQQQPPYQQPSAALLLQSPSAGDSTLLQFGNSSVAAAAVASSGLPAPPTPPSGTPSRSASVVGSMSDLQARSPPQPVGVETEWAIRPQSKLKYTQLFNTTDRTRCGFLTGAQARHMMVQSKLPQAMLAQIWTLADMDADGRLGCDEFVLAMYLCECAAQGEKIPDKLPPELIPPVFRKRLGSVASLHGGVGVAGSRHDSVVSATAIGLIGAGGSRHGSMSSQSGGLAGLAGGGAAGIVPGATMVDGGAGAVSAADAMAGLHNQTSFEDKRKENYDKGQAELERRRKVLVDAQRKEQDERERKEREETEKREKARLEAERRQQEEIERQMQRQREIEQEKEEKRLREIELKEAARKEMEKQRQQEWLRQRLSEMQLQRQHEQENVLKLKSLNQTHSIDLSKLTERIKELSQKICDTRASVTNVKSVIDGMRSTRDVQMAEMAQFKSQIVEQNQRLIQLSQEKSKLDKTKTSDGGVSAAADSDASKFSNKQIMINQLRGRIESAKTELAAKQSDSAVSAEELAELRSGLTVLIDECEAMYVDYDAQRTQLLEMKNNARNEQTMSATSAAAAWDVNGGWSSSSAMTAETEPVAAKAVTSTAAAAASSSVSRENANYEGYVRCRALYEFVGRNADEISFQPGDIVMVPIEQNAEPGWKAGEIDGHTGWFPESYVEPDDSDGDAGFDAAPAATAEPSEYVATQLPTNENTMKSPTDSALPIANTASANIPDDTAAVSTATAANGDQQGNQYVACYPYESAEPGDLTFVGGELITVVQKDGDWWTGIIGGTRTGIFPSNYVQPTNETVAANQANNNGGLTSSTAATAASSNAYDMDGAADEAKNLEDADSEVSEINTKPMMDAVAADQQQQQELFNRPMSTTSTSFRKQKGEVAQVIAAYEATSNEQLSLTRGQLIMIRKKADSGWWEGELQARGRRRQIGWFPATYVKVLQSGRLSGRSTPVSGGKIHMNEAVLDKVIALYTYKAQNDDELSFEKDDIISVMGRNEPEWWYGECSGLMGLFPSNYVGPFVNAGNM